MRGAEQRGTEPSASPGTRPNAPSTPPAMYIARGCAPSCVASARPCASPPAACVTMMPAAVLMISAGICVTRPSPTVRIVYCDSAWPIGRPFWNDADEDAADDVDRGDEQAGDRVALHELRRAVHRAVEVGLRARSRRGACGLRSRRSGRRERSASIAICLPGIASSVKRAATSAMRPAPLVMTMKLMPMRIRKSTSPTT